MDNVKLVPLYNAHVPYLFLKPPAPHKNKTKNKNKNFKLISLYQ
jgi:hypothetical protein